QSGEAGEVDGGRKNFVACRPHLPAGADRGRAKGARRTASDGQGDPASVTRADLVIELSSRLMVNSAEVGRRNDATTFGWRFTPGSHCIRSVTGALQIKAELKRTRWLTARVRGDREHMDSIGVKRT